MSGFWALLSNHFIDRSIYRNKLNEAYYSRSKNVDRTKILRRDSAIMVFHRMATCDISPISDHPLCIFLDNIEYNIMCCGDIYNNQELIRMHNINSLLTDSDSEIIVHLLHKYNNIEKVLHLINGDFSCIIDITNHKTEKRTRYVFRDPIGVRPLYYSLTCHGLLFVTNPKEINESMIMFPPGCYLTVNDIITKELTQYYKFNLKSELISNKDIMFRTVAEKFYCAVKKRLISTRKIGILVSGLHSALLAVVAYHNQINNLPVIISHDNKIAKVLKTKFISLSEISKRKIIMTDHGAHHLLGGKSMYDLAIDLGKLHKKDLSELHDSTTYKGIEARCPYLDKDLIDTIFMCDQKYINHSFIKDALRFVHPTMVPEMIDKFK
jgi:hypothetical protein